MFLKIQLVIRSRDAAEYQRETDDEERDLHTCNIF